MKLKVWGLGLMVVGQKGFRVCKDVQGSLENPWGVFVGRRGRWVFEEPRPRNWFRA